MPTKFFSGIISAVALLLAGCTGGMYLKTAEISTSGISGTYTLFLYGARYAADLQNVAILDMDGDPYVFEIYAPKFDYKIERGIHARDAVEKAGRFVRFHYASRTALWKKIIGPTDAIIGYEARPLYGALETGYPDILDITYVLRGNHVEVRIQFKPEIERAILSEEQGPLLYKGVR